MLQAISDSIGKLREEVKDYRQCMDHKLDELEHSVRHNLSLSLFLLLDQMPGAPFAESAQTTGAYCCSASKHNRGAM